MSDPSTKNPKTLSLTNLCLAQIEELSDYHQIKGASALIEFVVNQAHRELFEEGIEEEEKSDFAPTHVIIARHDTFPVQIVDGAAYTKEEHDACAIADYEYTPDHGLTFKGSPVSADMHPVDQGKFDFEKDYDSVWESKNNNGEGEGLEGEDVNEVQELIDEGYELKIRAYTTDDIAVYYNPFTGKIKGVGASHGMWVQDLS